jgi:hypothetical protein
MESDDDVITSRIKPLQSDKLPPINNKRVTTREPEVTETSESRVIPLPSSMERKRHKKNKEDFYHNPENGSDDEN